MVSHWIVVELPELDFQNSFSFSQQLKKKKTANSKQQHQPGVGLCALLHAGDCSGLNLNMFFTCRNHFVCAVSLLCSEDTVSLWLSTASAFQALSGSSSWTVPEPWEEEVLHVCTSGLSALQSAVSLCDNHSLWQTEASLMRGERCTNYGHNDESLEVGLILCPLSRGVVSVPLY